MDLGWIETLNLLTGCYAPNCKDFSKIIKDFELIDPLLLGGKYTWFRGNNKKCSLRIDKFLDFVEWDVRSSAKLNNLCATQDYII